MSNLIRNALGVAALILLAAPTQSAEPKLPRDGWVSWQVPATESTPDWCCWSSWENRDPRTEVCKLGERQGYGGRDGQKTDQVKIYARTKGSKLDYLQVLSATCPVQSKTPVQALEDVTPDDSVRWLVAQAKQGDGAVRWERSLAGDALTALAMHRGKLAYDEVADFARRDSRFETRKSAVFWMALVRGNEGADLASELMFADKAYEMRKHAAFALAQSKTPRVTPDLIKLGNTDKVAEVRAEAWFWLGQTAAPESEKALEAAARNDADDGVREKAIFALSQLPEDRATRALIAAAEDSSLSREQRRRAVFWLTQSQSDAALKYLDQVLAKNVAR